MEKIAIIAHDGKKPEMVNFLNKNLEKLKKAELVATGTTGTHVENTGLKVEKKLSGPIGGDAQIAGMGAEKKLAMILFFRDPLGKHPHEPDVQMLMRICDVHNIPIATNPATAQLLIDAFFKD
ncbi:methylglyoxal synthase [Psychroflexus sp. YR1-1]|uniref:Methylglyoxal synthase n=1 Tax=Psychroflexus aurantiacus TaxID=2709310 RepID=A0A6B3QZ45_9FLAO|nr:methylglyoxal synthase [Psychroflexus aurantiacus]NEV93092.1 methylglyoxal synthase [Psychroflexus aurantiacus]